MSSGNVRSFLKKTPEDEKSRDTVPLNMKHTTMWPIVAVTFFAYIRTYIYVYVAATACMPNLHVVVVEGLSGG